MQNVCKLYVHSIHVGRYCRIRYRNSCSSFPQPPSIASPILCRALLCVGTSSISRNIAFPTCLSLMSIHRENANVWGSRASLMVCKVSGEISSISHAKVLSSSDAGEETISVCCVILCCCATLTKLERRALESNSEQTSRSFHQCQFLSDIFSSCLRQIDLFNSTQQQKDEKNAHK